MRARSEFVLDEMTLRAAVAHDVREAVACWGSVSDVHNGGAFELPRKQHHAAITLFHKQRIAANKALQVLKVFFAKRGRHVVEAGRCGIVPHFFVIDGHVPPLGRRLHCNNTPGNYVEESKAHRRLGVAVGVHQVNGERSHVGCTVLVTRQQLYEPREAGLDAARGGGGALHVQVFADEYNSGADLKVAVYALDQPAK
jgi:hypothetical protein